MFGFGKKKEQKIEVNEGENRLFLHIFEGGWKALLVDGKGATIGDAWKGETLYSGDKGKARLENAFRMAAETLGRQGVGKDLKEVVLFLDDPSLLYLDAKQDGVGTRGPAALREFGIQQLNSRKATYGVQQFGKAHDDGEKSGSMFVFANADSLSKSISMLDLLATKITAIVPTGAMLLGRADQNAENPSAALYISEYFSLAIVTSTRFNTVSSRIIPVGLATLAEKMAAANSLPLKEAVESMAKRDLVSNIKLVEESDPNSSVSTSASQRILASSLRDMIGGVKDLIEFFDTQRLSGHPDSIEIFGDIERIKGLGELLQKELPATVIFPKQPILEIIKDTGYAGLANLLSGAEEGLVAVGKIRYTFQKDKLVPAQSLSQQQGALATSKDGRTTSSVGGKNIPGKGGKKGQAKKPPSGLAAAFDKLKQIGKKKEDVELTAADAEAQQDKQYFLLIVAAVLGVLYWGWTEYEDIAAKQTRQVSALAGEISTNTKLRNEVGRSGSKIKPAADADKVLWTEKFLALARNMNEAMWLTDVYLSDENRAIGQAKVISKKLTLEGAILPSTIGHILEIAKYIDNLLKDEKYFMSDFRDITFAGAAIDSAESEHIVRFTIEAWYDANKRIETNKAAGQGGVGPIDKFKAISDNRDDEITRAQRPGQAK